MSETERERAERTQDRLFHDAMRSDAALSLSCSLGRRQLWSFLSLTPRLPLPLPLPLVLFFVVASCFYCHSGSVVMTKLGPGKIKRYKKRSRCFVVNLDWKMGNGKPVRAYLQPTDIVVLEVGTINVNVRAQAPLPKTCVLERLLCVAHSTPCTV